MKEIKREISVRIADDEKAATDWLAAEYPHSIELVYIDYRDRYEDENVLQDVLRDGWSQSDDEWRIDSELQAIHEVIERYRAELGADEIADEVREAMQSWLYEHDTSNPTRDLLRNTGRKLMYFETKDYTREGGDDDQLSEIQLKYARTDAERKEIAHVLNEQFYSAPVSFYFYADAEDVYNALHNTAKEDGGHILIDGAYFSTIDRIQGSNWLGNKAIFKIALTRADFMEHVRLDGAKGNGYGWDSIAGQTGYDEAGISASATVPDAYMPVTPETSEAAKREQALADHWAKTKTCTPGDMNMSRHADTEYKNEFPCGTHCKKCGTFWID